MGADLGAYPAWAPRSGDEKKRGWGLLTGNVWGGEGNQTGRRHLRERVSGVDKPQNLIYQQRNRWASPPAFHTPIFLTHMGQKREQGAGRGS